MKNGFIYCIENKVNGKKYIGQTINFRKRRIEHFGELRRQEHNNSHLQRSFNKYGRNNFNMYILSTPKLDNIYEEEKQWIKYYNTYEGRGYNLTIGGEKLIGKHNPFYGRTHSKETKEKLRKASIDRESHKPLIKYKEENDLTGENNNFYGRKHTKETKRKMSLAKLKSAKRGKDNPDSKLDYSDVYDIIKYYFEDNLLQKEIAKKYNCSRRLISKVLNLNHWTTRGIKS